VRLFKENIIQIYGQLFNNAFGIIKKYLK